MINALILSKYFVYKTPTFKFFFTYKTCHILWKLKLKNCALIIEKIWEKQT